MNGCITAATALSTLPSLLPSRTSVKTGVVSVYDNLCPLPEARYEPVYDLLSVYSYLYHVPLTLFPVRTTVQTGVITPTGHSTLSYLCFFVFSLQNRGTNGCATTPTGRSTERTAVGSCRPTSTPSSARTSSLPSPSWTTRGSSRPTSGTTSSTPVSTSSYCPLPVAIIAAFGLSGLCVHCRLLYCLLSTVYCDTTGLWGFCVVCLLQYYLLLDFVVFVPTTYCLLSSVSIVDFCTSY